MHVFWFRSTRVARCYIYFSLLYILIKFIIEIWLGVDVRVSLVLLMPVHGRLAMSLLVVVQELIQKLMARMVMVKAV